MYKILEATYHQGNLILKDKLSESLEGKQIKIIVLEASDSQKESFLEKVDQHSFELPQDYQFNREELYD
jgi:predicted DNA-binding antitoxin AbrB/MazE fold protein